MNGFHTQRLGRAAALRQPRADAQARLLNRAHCGPNRPTEPAGSADSEKGSRHFRLRVAPACANPPSAASRSRVMVATRLSHHGPRRGSSTPTGRSSRVGRPDSDDRIKSRGLPGLGSSHVGRPDSNLVTWVARTQI
jgi:hypothetical protein